MKKEDGSDTYGLSQIGDILGRDFEIIARKWMEKERKELANASNAHRGALRNQIPNYLKALGVVLSTEKDGLIDHHLLARDHGIQRWTVGWVLSEVVADYQLLQITILEHLAEAMNRSLTIEEMKTFGAFIDEAIMVAVTAFTAESESALRSLNETLEERVIERTRLAEDRAEKLKKTAIELTKARQNERQRIARILHDDLQQLIAACRLRVEGLHLKMDETSFAGERDSVTQMLGNASRVSKDLALELRPPLDPKNVFQLLEWLQKKMQSEYNLDVAVGAGQNQVVVGEEIGLLVYHNLRELLFNVVKHGKCREVAVNLTIEEGTWLVVTVSDEGAGFDPSSPATSENGGFGLNYIRERLEMIDGRLEIWSMIGKGTRITMRLPTHLDA